jgi:molybdopterin converting factor small subunit
VPTVVLPRSLVALFPGAERRVAVSGRTVLEVLDALEEQVPGVRDRLIDAGPTIRQHLNVFVDGERAGLETPVAAASVVHVIPAVSGG